MKTLKSLILFAFTASSFSVSAQSLKEPIALKLNNGVNVLISENPNSEKAICRISLNENAFANTKDAAVETFFAMQSQNNDLKWSDRSLSVSAEGEKIHEVLKNAVSVVKDANLSQSNFEQAKATILNNLKTYAFDYDSSVNIESVNNLTLTDVQNFYSQLSPAKINLTIAGNIKTSATKSSLEKIFATNNKDEATIASIK